MSVDYNNFAKTFSSSRKNMKWEEIDFFMELIKEKKSLNILDIGCGNGRLLGELLNNKINISNYIGVDLSKGLLVEAKEQYQNFDFQELDMINLDKINKKFDVIFFIASFNHLDNLENRLETLKKAYNLLNNGGIIFMTNWALDSELNYEKYKKSIIYGSENHFGSKDYDIKIGKFIRYYHCFNLKELEYIFLKNGFKIIKNKLFNNKKNYISVIEKK